jgi:bacteriophage N4 adsorption protein B
MLELSAHLLELIFFELLLFSGFWFLIGALDDFFVDLIWLCRRGYRHLLYYRHSKPITADALLPARNPGRLAIFIPSWQEASVIGAMLTHCRDAWHNKGVHDIYVGCYPNDHAGISAVRLAAQRNPNIRLVICAKPGPTTKADCLNNIWQAMEADEREHGHRVKAVILHDAEDMVHADELAIYDKLIERSSAVQLPVIPIRVHGSRWISGHYCDEFAESHGKSLVVREALGVPLPLAGVGCAIERNMLGEIALKNGQSPFDENSLTEDYELGLKIGALGGKMILARLYAPSGELVGTRSCFPATLDTSVRQKTRWLTGIALAGWDRIGWTGGPAQFWMLFRDRKGIFAALVLVTAYICVMLAGLLGLAQLMGLYEVSAVPEAGKTLLRVNGFFLLWRLLVRTIFVWRLYGTAEAAYSIPRVVISNIIAIMAARRAVFQYLRHCLGAELKWDKTSHIHFPADRNNR